MKKGIAVLLLLILCLSLAACGESPEEIAKKTAEEHPELIGEWGTMLLSEDSIFTLREDGTCTYEQQEGKWTRDNKNSDDVRQSLMLKLDDGTDVNVSLMLEPYENYGEQWVANNYSDMLAVVNRDLYQMPQEIIDAICGTWKSSGKSSSSLTLNADGTCVVNGENGFWSLPDPNHYSADDNSYGILVQTEDGNYITFLLSTQIHTEIGDYFSKLRSQNQAMISYMSGKFPSGTYDFFAESAIRETDVEYIEITAENIFDYFERAEVSWWEKDAFDDYEGYQRQSYLQLKEEYVPRLCADFSEIALEIKVYPAYYKLEGILGSDDMTLVLDEADSEEGYLTQDTMCVHQTGIDNDVLYGIYISGFYMSCDYFGSENMDASGSYSETFEISRVAGNLCLTKE